MFFSTENSSGSTKKTKVLCFPICRFQTVPNKQVLKNQTFSFIENVLSWQLGNLWWSCKNPLFYKIFHWNHSRPLNNGTTLYWNISEPFSWNFFNRVGDWIEFPTFQSGSTLIPSMTELLSEISIVVGHECFNYCASLKG